MYKLKIYFLIIPLILLSVLLNTGCSKTGQNTVSSSIQVGQTWLPESTDPTNTSVPWALTSDGISETVYRLSRNGQLESRFITALNRKDPLQWSAHVNSGILFSDGTPVDARTLAECLNKIMQQNPVASATAGKLEFTPLDNGVLLITSERPVSNMSSVLAEWTDIVFKENENHQYIFTGPYKIDRLESGNILKLSPNPYYPDASVRSPVTVRKFQDENAMKLAFESGELDLAFTLTPDAAEMVKKEGHSVYAMDAGYQYFGLINMKDPFLKDIAVRQALNLAINRNMLVQVLKGGRPASGLFAHYFSFAGHDTPAFDAEKARQILHADGWTVNDRHLLEKDGKTLSIRLITYPSRPDLVLLMQAVASQLKEIGFDVSAGLTDNIDNELKNGTFSLALYAQHTAPAGDPSSFLNMFFRSSGPKNFMHYRNSALDEKLTELTKEENPQARDEDAIQIQHILFQDLPVLYLIDPQWYIGLSSRLSAYRPYNGDYYIINPDMKLSSALSSGSSHE